MKYVVALHLESSLLYDSLNNLKTKININYIETFISYRAVNTRLWYKEAVI
jgi:hypothetical protein